MNDERREAVLRQLELFRADAARNERAQQLGSLPYAYPQSLGEWLGTAVQIAATVSWQSHFALRPLVHQSDHERRIAEQGRAFIELYGALLAGAFDACDAALEREVVPELGVELPEIDSVLEVWDEAREERNGLTFSITALGEAIWIYGTCRDRNAALLPTIATEAVPGTLSPVCWLARARSCGGAFDHGGDVGWQLLGAPKRALDALDLEPAGGELADGLAGVFPVGERAAVAGEHSLEDRGCALLRLGVGAAEADQAAGAVIAGR